jgi:hypothetical protein
MSSALLVTLFAILGTGLAVTSAACVLLWRRVRWLTSASPSSNPKGDRDDSPVVSVVLPKGPTRTRTEESAARLDEFLSKHRALEARLARVEASVASAAMSQRPVGPRRNRRFDAGGSATSAGPTLISVPDLAAPPASNPEAAAELDRRFGPVWAMADDGTPIDAIARETGYPIGQVELILGLRRRLLVAEAGPDA